jgi:hypothetical protein
LDVSSPSLCWLLWPGSRRRSFDRSLTVSLPLVCFSVRACPKRLDLVHPAAEKITLVLEGIGDNKIHVNSSSLTILPDQGIEFVGIAKKVMVGRVTRPAYWLNHDPSGLVEAGYGPEGAVTASHHNIAHCDSGTA